MKSECGVAVLGAGLSGLAAAAHLEGDYEIFEKEGQPGGLCRSHRTKGFTFDVAGHILHFRDKKNLLYVRDLLNGQMVLNSRSSWVWSCQRFVPYPFQSNLQSLPAGISRECLEGFQKAQKTRRSSARPNGLNFKSWLLATFGEGIARHFLFPYNEKFWKHPLGSLSEQGAKEWIPVPTLKEAAQGPKRNSKEGSGYNANFWYPRGGGIQALVDALGRRIKKVHTRSEVIRLDLKEQEVFLKNGSRIKFKKALSTIPLPELASILTPLPKAVRQAILSLKYVSVFNVNLGLLKSLDRDKHWIYFPQKEISFYRMGIATNFLKKLAPNGCSSLYFEFSYTKDAPIEKKGILDRIVAGCRKAGYILREEDIAAVNINDIKYGYCVYDHARASALKVIEDYLKMHGVFCIGRYGRWRYASMEDVMVEAQEVAKTIKSKL